MLSPPPSQGCVPPAARSSAALLRLKLINITGLSALGIGSCALSAPHIYLPAEQKAENKNKKIYIMKENKAVAAAGSSACVKRGDGGRRGR